MKVWILSVRDEWKDENVQQDTIGHPYSTSVIFYSAPATTSGSTKLTQLQLWSHRQTWYEYRVYRTPASRLELLDRFLLAFLAKLNRKEGKTVFVLLMPWLERRKFQINSRFQKWWKRRHKEWSIYRMLAMSFSFNLDTLHNYVKVYGHRGY